MTEVGYQVARDNIINCAASHKSTDVRTASLNDESKSLVTPHMQRTVVPDTFIFRKAVFFFRTKRFSYIQYNTLLHRFTANWFIVLIYIIQQNKTKAVALVCKRTIPTERPPLVGEVSAYARKINLLESLFLVTYKYFGM
jgi:hypothetical protein